MPADRGSEALTKSVKSNSLVKSFGDKDLDRFVKVFLGRAPVDDLEDLPPGDLAEIVLGAWSFFGRRNAGRHKIKLHNPPYKRPGPTGGFTVIEILNDDMPFLFDSILGALNNRKVGIKCVLHPIFAVERNGEGKFRKFASEKAVRGNTYRESLIHIHVDHIAKKADRAALERELSGVLDDVRTVVLDWPLMRERVADVISAFQNMPPPVPVDELGEAIQFLDWLNDNNFTFLGTRQYNFVGGAKAGELKARKGSGLGLLRDAKVQVLRRGREMVAITPEVREFLMQPAPLIITKANVRSTVHRRVHMDYIGIKQFDVAGRLTGELRVIGLFTSTAYTRNPRNIPYLRRKIAEVMEHSGLLPSSHSGKAMLNVLENYPRDELFQIDVPTLTKFANGIHLLVERPRTRLFVRRDKFDRFVSILVYVPRDRYNTDVRVKIGDLLARAFDGRVSAYFPSFPEGTLVRIHYVIGRYEGTTPTPSLRKLEAQAARLVLTWEDHLEAALNEKFEPARALTVSEGFLKAFTAAYQEAFSVEQAIADIERLETAADERSVGIDFYRLEDEPAHLLRLKLYNHLEPIALSDRLPLLENMGLRAINERSYRASRSGTDGASEFWIHDIVLEASDKAPVRLATVKPLLEACYLAVWQGVAENDGYNTLVSRQALQWRDVSVLRGYAKFLRQTGIAFSQDYMAATLVKHGHVARRLVDLFHARHAPGKISQDQRHRKQASLISSIERALSAVVSLDEDRILRHFVTLMMATVRTNFFATDAAGKFKPALAFKIDSQKVDILPEPRPYAEIFVYAPDVEGVHLRAGKIARGGLRWSDRPEDFRTEVLGLAKAQQVKNAVIVPVGAKGGFVPKNLPVGGTRDDVFREGTRCYKIFIGSLLDVTDNLAGKGVKSPQQVVRHDEDDPYLVVAADKGTATFSDTANGISQARGFWLDDAFASGGSAGYDHKKMGITARGGWEAVKRHFREMDIDIQTTPFDVIGVGDMSGDVFGNGMLLSEHIRLKAAFDHRDIFIDPNPKPGPSFAERKRLFNLTRSSWQDYAPKLISKGGGVFSRSEKSIKLTPEIKRLTKLKSATATPDDLINAILKMGADLLWFGGIGTYVRAAGETDAEVGDRTNDAIRVSAAELNVRVIGEGANLGITQLGRMEFARGGGRINTDAVDNSAGVNSSDLEVNIKVAFGQAEAGGRLSRSQRNKLLVKMTEEVAELVLRNNYLQTLSLTLTERAGLEELEFQSRFMRGLEQKGLLNRAIEFLPDDMTIAERAAAGEPLTRPELSVLMAYAKITLFDALMESRIPDDAYFATDLARYFPGKMREKYADEIASHRLRREIISTMLANSMINRGGPTFVSRIADETGAGIPDIAAAFALAKDTFSLTRLSAKIDAVDNKVSGEVQTALYLELWELLRRQTIWYLRNVSFSAGLEQQVERFRVGIDGLAAGLTDTLPKPLRSAMSGSERELISKRVPADIARAMSRLPYLSRASDIVIVAEQTGRPLMDAARVLFALGERLGIAALAERAAEVKVADYFDRLALNRQIENLFAAQRGLAVDVLRQSGRDSLATWWSKNQDAAVHTETTVQDMLSSGEVSLAKLAVAGGYVRDLLQA